MPKKIAALLFVCVCFLPLPASCGDDLAKLAKAQRDAAEKAYKAYFVNETRGSFQHLTLYNLSIPWLNADLNLAKKKEERIAAYSAHLQRMNDWEKEWKRVGADPAEARLLAIATFQREAEYWLAKERSTKK